MYTVHVSRHAVMQDATVVTPWVTCGHTHLQGAHQLEGLSGCLAGHLSPSLSPRAQLSDEPSPETTIKVVQVIWTPKYIDCELRFFTSSKNPKACIETLLCT